MGLTKEWREIVPTNAPADQTYSQSTGQSSIVFPISSEMAFLKPASVRLCGDLSLRIFDNQTPSVEQAIDYATITQRLFSDWRMGVYSALSQLTIRTLQTQQEIESINNYDQLMSILQPSLHSQEDYVSGKSCLELATNSPLQQEKLFDGGASTAFQIQQSFSSRVYSGLLYNGEPILLDERAGCGGLELNFRLQVPQQVLTDLNGSVGGASFGIGAEFVITNPTLQYELLRPDGADAKSIMGSPARSLNYNTASSLVSVINSGDHSAVFQVGNSMGVKSILAKFVPTNFLNSYGNLSNGLGEPRTCTNGNPIGTDAGYNAKANLRKVSFFVGGQLAPLDFAVVRNTGSSAVLKSQLTREGLNAVRTFTSINHLIPDARIKGDDNLFLNQKRQVDVGANATASSNYVDTYKGGEFFIAGANYAPYSQGRPMKNDTITFEIQSDIAEFSDSPNTAYMFLFNENKAVVGGGRVEVSV